MISHFIWDFIFKLMITREFVLDNFSFENVNCSFEMLTKKKIFFFENLSHTKNLARMHFLLDFAAAVFQSE